MDPNNSVVVHVFSFFFLGGGGVVYEKEKLAISVKSSLKEVEIF